MANTDSIFETSTIIGVEAPNLHDNDFQEVFGYWNTLRGLQLAPSWADFDLLQLPTKLIPSVVVMDIMTDPLDFQYRFWGTRFTDVHAQDLTGKSIMIIEPKELGVFFFNQNKTTFEAKKACLFANRIPAGEGIRGLPTNETILRMPLSDDGEAITHIVSVVDFGKQVDAYMTYLERAK